MLLRISRSRYDLEMKPSTLTTNRCQLRPAIKKDAEWMLKLFNDKEVVAYIDGIKWFNTSVNSVRAFITSMKNNSDKSQGILWCVMVGNCPAGIIMANDLDEDPYLTFALFKEYRGQNIGSEIFNVVNEYVTKNFGKPTVETENPIVKKITKRKCEYLFIGNRYYSSLNELKDTLTNINPIKESDKQIIEEILSIYRDETLINWLYYLAQKGEEECLDVVYSLRNLSKDDGDRALLQGISKILCTGGNVVLNNDLNSRCRINPTARIKDSLKESDINIFDPINLKSTISKLTVTLSFEILHSSHDIIDVEVNGCHKKLPLGTKKKTIFLDFPITIKGTAEERFDVIMDGEISHTLYFQKYPNKEWDNKKCTLTGISHLYSQDYKKASLCFNRYKSAADLFWLGIMEYIGVNGEPNPKGALVYFEKASQLKPATSWNYLGDVFSALMILKGEGTKEDINKASNLIANYNSSIDGIDILKKAISGNLDDSKYNTLLYSYNISDCKHIPRICCTQTKQIISPKYLLDTYKPFDIVVDQEMSAKIKQSLNENDSLHAHIGVTTESNGDWQYVIENDWRTNAAYNTLEYDSQSKCYVLKIWNIIERQHILPTEKVLKLNLILRTSGGSKQFPEYCNYYAINCLTNSSYIALCNISPFLLKFPEISSVLQSLGLEFEPIEDSILKR